MGYFEICGSVFNPSIAAKAEPTLHRVVLVMVMVVVVVVVVACLLRIPAT